MSTNDAAQEFGISPANLILRLKVLGACFEECWPNADEHWYKTLVELASDHARKETSVSESEPETEEGPEELPCSWEAAHVLEKLWRNRKWGDCYVSSESAAKMANLGVSLYKDAREELVEMGLVMLQAKKRNAISLDPSKNAEILEVLKAFGLEMAE